MNEDIDPQEEYMNKLIDAHVTEAKRLKVKITNLGWAMDGDGICSKTNKGLLDTRDTGNGFEHNLDGQPTQRQ